VILVIIRAEYITGHKVKLKFSDGKERTINFEPVLKQSRNPMTRKFLDLNEFKKFKIEYGDLIWNDYELCFPIIDLYEDNLLKDLSSAA
jgi:hypothetical protein